MNYLLQIMQTMLVISLVVGVVWLFGGLLGKRAGYRWRKMLWFVLAICLLVSIPFPLSGIVDSFSGLKIEVEIPGGINWGEENSQNVNPTEGNLDIATAPHIPADDVNAMHAEGYLPLRNSSSAGVGLSPATCIVLVWIIGTVMLLAYRTLQYISLKKNYFAVSLPCEDSVILECRDRLCKAFNIRKEIPVRLMKSTGGVANSPMLFGYIRTILLVPCTQYETRELEAIMRHELTHYRSKDLWYKLLMMVACDVYWFNPILRLMKKMAFHDVEFVCDEKATESFDLDAKKVYSSTILKTMSGARGTNLVFATRFAGNKKSAKERFENIFASHNRKAGIAILCLLILVIAVGCVCVSVSVLGKDDETVVSEEAQSSESDAVENDDSNQALVPEEMQTITIDATILSENADALLAELREQYPDCEITVVTPASYYWDEEVDGPVPTLYQTYGGQMYGLAEAGEVADITDILAERGWLEQMDDAAKVTVSDANGRVYGIPNPTSYAFGIMANVKLFEEAGLVDEAGMPIMPATWEELVQTAVTIKNATGQAGFCWNAGSDSFVDVEHYINMAWCFGATDFITAEADGSYKTHLDSDEAIAAMEYIKDLKWKYNVLTEDPSKETFMSGYERLANGTAAMYMSANDALYLPISCGMDSGNLALGAVPAGPDGKQYSFYASNVFVFSADAKAEEIDVALSLLEMLGLGPVANDVSKNRIQSKIESTAVQGGLAIREIPVWKNEELLEYEQSVIAELGNTNQALYRSYFNSVLTPGNRKSLNTIANSELYMELDEVLKAVMTDSNADVAQLMKSANDNWQIVVEHYVTE